MFTELSRIFAAPARIKLLKSFLLYPESRKTAAEAAAAIGLSKNVAERDARALAQIGILTLRGSKKKKLYSANQGHEFYEPLRSLLNTTLPDDRALLSVFRGVSGVALIVATGVLALEERSAIDLLIVAKRSQNPRLGKAVMKLERITALPLRYVILEPQIFSERVEAHDRLLRDVFEFKNRVILGKAP
ncbi:MAG: hypothetical protein JO026_00670 [Patescibacteria group bacterium]|nr:hypothetical protein [Patescibacteria group bacterium]